MTKTHEWAEIMQGLRGRRLEVYDDIIEGRVPVVSDLRVQEALGWLVFNRFVFREGDRYQARQPAPARAMWTEFGPARAEAADVCRVSPATSTEPQPAPAIEPSGEPAAAKVHRMRPGQTELFP